jgi:hypothetical protein
MPYSGEKFSFMSFETNADVFGEYSDGLITAQLPATKMGTSKFRHN